MKFEFYANHSHMDKNQISENEKEINWFKINSFGCNIVARWLIQHWEEKHGSKSKHTEKKFKGKCWQELIRFLRLRSQFWFFFKKKNSIFTCLTLNMLSQSERMEFHLSTHLITSNYPVILSHRRSNSVSSETYPLYLTYRFSNLDWYDHSGSWLEDKFFKLLLFRNLHRQQGKNTSKTFIYYWWYRLKTEWKQVY